MSHAHIIIAIVMVVVSVLFATCIGIALYMNRANKPQVGKSNDESVKKKPIPDIENLDMAVLFERKGSNEI